LGALAPVVYFRRKASPGAKAWRRFGINGTSELVPFPFWLRADADSVVHKKEKTKQAA
jgi:hypothetical protein